MRNKERVLAIGAHCDDTEFGCLGTLLKHKKKGASFYFQWFSAARNARAGSYQVMEYFSANGKFHGYTDQRLDKVDFIQLIADIETAVNEFNPSIAYIPFIGDLNRDHRIASEASMVALRPYKFKLPPKVFMYTIPGTTELGLRPFKVDKKVRIDVKEKTRLLKLWYPQELINGREKVNKWEVFEKWPR